MKTLNNIIRLILMVVLLMAGSAAASHSRDLTEGEALFLTLLNQQRTRGLVLNADLQSAADGHCVNMSEKLYFSETAMDGRSAIQRMIDAGVDSGYKNEKIGMIMFKGYVNETLAATLLFNNMVNVAQGSEAAEALLSSTYGLAGISIRSAYWKTSTMIFNVYVCVCSLGSEVSTSELEMVQMINQARVNPAAVAGALGIAVGTGEVLPTAQPLTVDPTVAGVARNYALDMFTRGFLSEYSPEGMTPYDRVAAAGYAPSDVRGMVGIHYLCPEQSLAREGVMELFRAIVEPVIANSHNVQGSVLDPWYTEAGAGFVMGESVMYASSCGNSVVIMDLEMYRPAEPVSTADRLTGVFFDDVNQDGICEPGEGIEGAVVVVYDSVTWEQLASVSTDGAGGWMVSGLVPGSYVVGVTRAGAEATYAVAEQIDGNQFVFVKKAPDVLDISN
ncbi:MAG: CAP domain-containing protein [Pseudomonadota bacterium]